MHNILLSRITTNGSVIQGLGYKRKQLTTGQQRVKRSVNKHSPNLDNTDAVGNLRQPFRQLLLLVLRSRRLNLIPDLCHSLLYLGFVATTLKSQ